MLTHQEIERYHRHLILEGFGLESQEKIKAARVLVIGAGGLGSPLLIYLAAAGVGTIGIIDADSVEVTNLQRQVLFSTESIGQLKVAEAQKRLSALNPLIQIHQYPFRCTADNIMELLKDYDLIADGSDNFATRYLVNDACVLSGKPFVYTAIHQFQGQIAVFNYRTEREITANYRDIFPSPPSPDSVPDCSEAGVLGVLPGILGSMQALEVIKIITGIGTPLINKLGIFDALHFRFTLLDISKDPNNPLTGEAPSIFTLQDYEAFCNSGLGSDVPVITAAGLASLMKQADSLVLLDIREHSEHLVDSLGGINIPMNQWEAIQSAIPWDKTCVLYCQSGKRSEKVVLQLKKLHLYPDLFSLKGGLKAFREYENLKKEK